MKYSRIVAEMLIHNIILTLLNGNTMKNKKYKVITDSSRM